MPAKAVTVTATYECPFPVTIAGGTSDGKTEVKAFAGEPVTVVANEPEEGCRFVKWESADVEIPEADAAETTLTFTMPGKAVTVTATYECPFPVTVVDGTADKDNAFAREQVTVTADEPEEGKVFDKWESDDIEIPEADAAKTTLTFTMPAKAVTVTATYKDKPDLPDEWPEDTTLYAPTLANGGSGIFREPYDPAVTFSWPAINNAESYTLTVATYDGKIVYEETLEETSCTVNGLKRGSFVWSVTANGDDYIAGSTADVPKIGRASSTSMYASPREPKPTGRVLSLLSTAMKCITRTVPSPSKYSSIP